MTSVRPSPRILIAIPAYNEHATIDGIVARVRMAMPEYDLLVVNDGSRDATGRILEHLGVLTATHLCNLGYGRAIQTAIKFALHRGYDTLITLDADGQHQPEQIPAMYRESLRAGWDLFIGSRYIQTHDYSRTPLGRRIGMKLFSTLVRLLTHQRIYDTTSGLKIIDRRVFGVLTRWHFVDFHAEAIVYLLLLGYRVGEFPVTAAERRAGRSMYSALSHLTYPLQTLLMILLGLIEARLTRRRQS